MKLQRKSTEEWIHCLENREEMSQRVQKHELHISEGHLLQEDGQRHGQIIGKNHFLISSDSFLWEKSSRKLDSTLWTEKAQWAKQSKGSHQTNNSESQVLSSILFQKNPFLPAVPHAAHRGLRSSKKKKTHTGSHRSRVIGRFNSPFTFHSTLPLNSYNYGITFDCFLS